MYGEIFTEGKDSKSPAKKQLKKQYGVEDVTLGAHNLNKYTKITKLKVGQDASPKKMNSPEFVLAAGHKGNCITVQSPMNNNYRSAKSQGRLGSINSNVRATKGYQPSAKEAQK